MAIKSVVIYVSKKSYASLQVTHVMLEEDKRQIDCHGYNFTNPSYCLP